MKRKEIWNQEKVHHGRHASQPKEESETGLNKGKTRRHKNLSLMQLIYFVGINYELSYNLNYNKCHSDNIEYK